MKYTLVLVRHGESTWNNENRFTGWVDCPLSPKGEEEAKAGGKLLREEGFTFDKAHTSTLKRAIKTLWLILEELNLMYIPIENNWRLNERHYGPTLFTCSLRHSFIFFFNRSTPRSQQTRDCRQTRERTGVDLASKL